MPAAPRSHPALLWLAALSGALAIAAALPGGLPPPVHLVCKPLTTLLLIAWARPRGDGSPMQPWVRAGLGLSLAGDVALMWPETGFLPGLVSFLLAHLCYLRAFTRHARLARWPLLVLAFAAVAAAVLSGLWAGVPAPLRGAVVVYVGALSLMAAQASIQYRQLRQDARREAASQALRAAAAAAPWGALGGALFMVSDALLATNRFNGPLPAAALWVLSSYWVAQGLIARALPAGNTPAPA